MEAACTLYNFGLRHNEDTFFNAVKRVRCYCVVVVVFFFFFLLHLFGVFFSGELKEQTLCKHSLRGITEFTPG